MPPSESASSRLDSEQLAAAAASLRDGDAAVALPTLQAPAYEEAAVVALAAAEPGEAPPHAEAATPVSGDTTELPPGAAEEEAVVSAPAHEAAAASALGEQVVARQLLWGRRGRWRWRRGQRRRRWRRRM